MNYENGKPFFVVCRNMSEFITYRNAKIKEYTDKKIPYRTLDFVFVGEVWHLRGHINVHGTFYGNWKLNPNIKDIIEALHYSGRDIQFKLPESILEFYHKEFSHD